MLNLNNLLSLPVNKYPYVFCNVNENVPLLVLQLPHTALHYLASSYFNMEVHNLFTITDSDLADGYLKAALGLSTLMRHEPLQQVGHGQVSLLLIVCR